MAFADLLINTCDVKRFTEGDADAYGNKEKTWTTVLNDELCRLVAGPGREIQVGAQVVIADYSLFIGDVSITEQDRVVIDDITYEILSVLNRQDGTEGHHKQAFLRTVR